MAACALVCIALFDLLAMFFPNRITTNVVVEKFLTQTHYDPRHRDDIDEVDRLLGVLEGLATEADDRIYVLAASDTLNSHVLMFAHLSLGRHEAIGGKVMWTHDIDKRDGFPNHLLTAKYLVVADPVQYSFNPDDQRVVGIPAEFVLAQKNIGTSYERLPYEFSLDQGVKVYIYKKVRPFNDADIAQLSNIFKGFYPDRPKVYEIKR